LDANRSGPKRLDLAIRVLKGILQPSGEAGPTDLMVPVRLDGLTEILLGILSDNGAFEPHEPRVHPPEAQPTFEERVKALRERLGARFEGG
jgi:hypothetical protein